MKIEKEELATILAKFNPWWRGEKIADLPNWKRAAFGELYKWVSNPPAARAAFISGARQVGKTTLIMQAIDDLIKSGVHPSNILYATFDHPLLKLAGIDAVVDSWRQREARREGMDYVFLDEAQFIHDWGTWVKHQVDFNKNRRIIFTGSATPILSGQESGVGRWHNIRLTTLSFYEYIQLNKIAPAQLPKIKSLREIFDWNQNEIDQVSEVATSYISHFHDYLVRGGFPQTASIATTVNQAQKLLREDIIDKALKRDMTAMFGVRRVLELEQTFLYLCMHDGAILNMVKLCSNLDNIKRPTAQNFIELLEAAHLVYKLQPFGYGTEILRGKHKVYLSDPAIAPAVMMKGQSIIDNAEALGISAESAVLKHLFARYYSRDVRFSYWQNKKGLEVDLVAETGGEIIPFEVKYRAQHTSIKDCKGLVEFCLKHKIKRGYIVTKSTNDFGIISQQNPDSAAVLKIPATLLCYFMGEMEISQN